MNLKERFDLFIFDLDGTLLDSEKDIANSINFALRGLGLEEKDSKEMMNLLSQGSQGIIKSLLSDESRLDEVLDVFSTHYEENLLVESIFYDGVDEVLGTLNGKTLAVMSNKREHFCVKILEGLGQHEQFKMILGGDSVGVKKPDPKPLLHILETLSVSPGRAVMIGDSLADVEAGKKAGMYTIGLRAGFTSEEIMNRSEADLLVDHIRDLKSHL